MAALLDGLVRALAPIAPHLAEDAWQNLPHSAPAASVFQAGWRHPPEEWGSLSGADQDLCKALLAIRAEANQVRVPTTGSLLAALQGWSQGASGTSSSGCTYQSGAA